MDFTTIEWHVPLAIRFMEMYSNGSCRLALRVEAHGCDPQIRNAFRRCRDVFLNQKGVYSRDFRLQVEPGMKNHYILYCHHLCQSISKAIFLLEYCGALGIYPLLSPLFLKILLTEIPSAGFCESLYHAHVFT
jgi:hypothetical protein